MDKIYVVRIDYRCSAPLCVWVFADLDAANAKYDELDGKSDPKHDWLSLREHPIGSDIEGEGRILRENAVTDGEPLDW